MFLNGVKYEKFNYMIIGTKKKEMKGKKGSNIWRVSPL